MFLNLIKNNKFYAFAHISNNLNMKRSKTTTDVAAKKLKLTKKVTSDATTTAVDGANVSKDANEQAASVSKTKLPTYTNLEEFMAYIRTRRTKTADSIMDFSFKKKRIRVLSKAMEVKEDCAGPIVYWMSRDARVQDNWAFLFAQKLALKFELPLVVVFCLVPKFLNATLRHYKFLLGGLEEVEQECRDLNIQFHLLHGSAATVLPKFVRERDVGAVVCDMAPLRLPRKWLDELVKELPADIPLTQVDAHNIVPLWVASEKQEYSARTIRGKISTKLSEFLTEFPPVIKHPHQYKLACDAVDWKAAHDMLECDMTVDAVDWAKPGYKAACKQLYEFCTKRLSIFHDKRNDPTVNALSGLSPWFHFGHISVQRCILEVKRYQSKHKAGVDAFCEEAIIRRELADNFCYYNEHYDNLKGLHDWAYKTLNDHRKDKRSPCYELAEFEAARTHDDLWNSAQLQLIKEGKMHGFLRMYWAKKILEWAPTPELALEIAILLNDKYSLDGRDPNGYVGCMWSIGGIHDQGWAERPVFGKVRYMNYQGCKRKFNIAAFIARYGGKVYTKK